MARIYLASSWRNQAQQLIVSELRAAGHEVYDFKNPAPGNIGFSWRQCGMYGDERELDAAQTLALLNHPVAQAGFKLDHDAMEWADTFVMLLPCGRSAHLELGWACGAGKRTMILQPERQEPELMYLEAGGLFSSLPELIAALA
jgi:hypothetical protein